MLFEYVYVYSILMKFRIRSPIPVKNVFDSELIFVWASSSRAAPRRAAEAHSASVFARNGAAQGRICASTQSRWRVGVVGVAGVRAGA